MIIDRPRSNRVTPFGTFEAAAVKCGLMGNRGDLHAADGNLGNARWRGRAWLACSLAERGSYRVQFDRRGTYFPLFFHDEAVAFAAGHRPCAECRRADYLRFKAAWRVAFGLDPDAKVGAAAIDGALHAARLYGRRQRTHAAQVSDLPVGSFFVDPTDEASALRVDDAGFRRWSHGGYASAVGPPPDARVAAVTPEPLLAVLRSGYVLDAVA